jgi:RsiW-degrading membrane proteinase PrsW (M82 family)
MASSNAKLTIAKTEEAKPSFIHQRPTIRYSLLGISALVTILVLTCCTVSLSGFFGKEQTWNSSIASVINTMFIMLTITFSAIIGSFCFGQIWDNNLYRNFLVKMTSAMPDDVNKPDDKSKI